MLQLSWIQKFSIKVLKQGHIPEHIAFIMDGNRRFAKHQNNKALSGHAQGAQTLKKCLLYCLQLGVKYSTFYAFSLQNFKRTDEQVNFLMNLARKQFITLSEIYQQDNFVEIVTKNNVKVVVVGDLDGCLKERYPDVRQNFGKLQERTKNNTKMTLYICFAYDSIFEYNRAVQLATVHGSDSEQITDKQGEQRRFFDNLLIPHPVDLLIRTSNEYRLSNFMLAQIKYGLIEIQKGFWPAFNLFTLGKILLKYNYYYNEIKCKKIRNQTENKQL